MAIKRQRRGGRVYVSEYRNYREGGKVKSEFIRYLGVEDESGTPRRPRGRTIDRMQVSSSYQAGDVGLLWHLVQELDLVRIIDRICIGPDPFEGRTPGKLLTAWAISRCVSPRSVTRLARWLPATDLPRLIGLPPEAFTKDAFLDALDLVCADEGPSGPVTDLTASLDEAFARSWREKHLLDKGENEVLAYDMTSVLFFGVSCPLAELGYNPDRIKRRQVNLALLVSKREKYPLAHFVYKGNRNGASTVKNLLTRLQQTSLGPGTLILDRGMTSAAHVKAVEESGWKLICGVPKTVKSALQLLSETKVPTRPDSLARGSKAGVVYATKVDGRVYGKLRSMTIYTNAKRAGKELDDRNAALAIIGEELDQLAAEGVNLGEKELHARIKQIVRSHGQFISARVSRKGAGPRIVWKYLDRELKHAERADGKWILLSSDTGLSAKEVVNAYLEKDFIEKAFRTMKTDEEIAPVRHRLEHRVRAYLFVCVLAYRLLSYLQWQIQLAEQRHDGWEAADDLLGKLGRVQRTEVSYGKDLKPVYLNLTDDLKESMKALGLGKLFKD